MVSRVEGLWSRENDLELLAVEREEEPLVADGVFDHFISQNVFN